MKKTIAAVATVFAMFAGSSVAAPVIWGNVYTDMLINDNASVKESQIIGIEGGLSTKNVDVYGFFEHNPDLENEFGKVTVHKKVYEDFTVYGHGTMFKEGDFSENRYVVGAGYAGFAGEDYSIKPYVGFVRVDSAFSDEGLSVNTTTDNVAFGYAGYYALTPETTLSSWADARVDGDDDNKVKVQGSVGIQHDLMKQVYIGAFYNMNYGEQGQKHFSDSVQLRVGYKF